MFWTIFKQQKKPQQYLKGLTDHEELAEVNPSGQKCRHKEELYIKLH